MPARPQDTISQRRLVIELRLAIDRARAAQEPTAHAEAIQEVMRIAHENPTSINAPFVSHNIGRARREWLTSLVGRAAKWMHA
jgi:hypothetical protein